MDVKTKRWIMVILGIMLNALGNAMLAYSGLGNTYWGIAAENIAAYTGITFGNAIIAITVCLFIYNRITLKQYRPILDTLSFIVTILFGFLIDFFINILAKSIDLTDNIVLANIVWIVGLLIMALSISMYLKPNLIVPAFDENMGVLAKQFFNGNLAKAGYLAMAVAMVITLIVGLLNDKQFIGFNLHSLFIIFTFGPLINFFFNHFKAYDKFIEFGEFDKSEKSEQAE